MEFYEADEDGACNRLLGVPADWNYGSEPPRLLLQFDPLDSEMGFLDRLDGFLYFFFEDDGIDFSKVFICEEYS